MSNLFQSAIAISASDWLQDHPTVFRLLQILVWMTNHPIIGVVILLFVIAIAWNLVKAIGRLIDMIGRSILQAPIKVIQLLFGVGAKSIGTVSGLAVKPFLGTKPEELPALPPASAEPIQQDRQQRLAEISSRLDAIQKEQHELLQEVATLLTTETQTQPLEEKTHVG